MMPPGFLVPVPSGRILVHPIENLGRIRVKRWTDATQTYSSQVPQPTCCCLALSRASGLGNLTRPIAGESHLLHQSHILLVVVVTVTGHISAGPVHNVARHLVCYLVAQLDDPWIDNWLSVLFVDSQYSLVCEKDVGGSHLGEHVPDARTLAVLVPSALDLVELQIGKFFLNENLPDRQLWPIPRGSHQERYQRAALPQDCRQEQEQGCSVERRRLRTWPSSQTGLPRLPRCSFQVVQGDKANCAKGSLCTQDFE